MEAAVNDLSDQIAELGNRIGKIGNHPGANIVPYSGTTDKRSFQTFIRQFNKVGTSYGWDEADMCRHLPVHLKGEASATYDELGTDVKANWQDLADNLAQKFGVGESSHSYRRTLQSRKQREGESFPEYGQSLADMADKAFHTAGGFTDDIRKNMILDLFLNGVKPSVKEHLRRRERPGTLADAIQAAQEEEELQNELKREKIATEQVALINYTSNWGQNMRNSVGNRFQNFGNSFRPRGGQFSYQRGNFRNSRGGYCPNFPSNRNFQNPNNYFNNTRNNFGNNNSNFQRINNRGQRGNRRPGRGRGGYRINNVEIKDPNEGLVPVKQSTNTPSTFLPLITILSIIFGLIIVVNANGIRYGQQSYQICPNRDFLFYLSPPENYNCSIPDTYDILELEAEIIVRRIEPILFPIFKCSIKTNTICTFSIFKLYTDIAENVTIEEKLPVEECWKLITTGKIKEYELVRESGDVWATKTTATLQYSWLGKECNSSSNYIVEKALAATKGKKQRIITDLVGFGNCTIETGFCEAKSAIVVWKTPLDKDLCDFQSIGTYPAIITEKYILIEKFQAAFTYSGEEIKDMEIRGCMPKNTYPMNNDVFISLPKQKRFIFTEDKILVPILPNFDSESLEREEDEVPREKRNAVALKKPKAAPTIAPRRPALANPAQPTLPRIKSTASSTPKPTQVTTTSRPVVTTTSRPTTSFFRPVTETNKAKNSIVTTRKPPTTTASVNLVTTREAIIPTLSPAHTTTTVTTTTMGITTTKMAPTTVTVTLTTNPTQRTLTMPRRVTPQTNTAPTSFTKGSTVKPISDMVANKNQVILKQSIFSNNITNQMVEITGKRAQEQLRKENLLKKGKLWIEEIKRLTVRREVPINNTETEQILSNKTESQSNYNLNTRLQFYDSQTEIRMRKNFELVFSRICDLHNKHLEIVRTLLKIDTSNAVRAWLNRHDLTATYRGEALAIFECESVIPTKFYWNNKIDDKCYNNTPVEVGGRVFFIAQGSRDLISTSAEIKCSERVKQIYRENDVWRSVKGNESVISIINRLPLDYQKSSIILKAKSPYKLETTNLFDSMVLLSTFANRINARNKVLNENNVQINDTNLMEELGALDLPEITPIDNYYYHEYSHDSNE